MALISCNDNSATTSDSTISNATNHPITSNSIFINIISLPHTNSRLSNNSGDIYLTSSESALYKYNNSWQQILGSTPSASHYLTDGTNNYLISQNSIYQLKNNIWVNITGNANVVNIDGAVINNGSLYINSNLANESWQVAIQRYNGNNDWTNLTPKSVFSGTKFQPLNHGNLAVQNGTLYYAGSVYNPSLTTVMLSYNGNTWSNVASELSESADYSVFDGLQVTDKGMYLLLANGIGAYATSSHAWFWNGKTWTNLSTKAGYINDGTPINFYVQNDYFYAGTTKGKTTNHVFSLNLNTGVWNNIYNLESGFVSSLTVNESGKVFVTSVTNNYTSVYEGTPE